MSNAVPPADSKNPWMKSPPKGEKKNSQKTCLVVVPLKQLPGGSIVPSTKKSGRLPSVATAVWAEAQPSETQPGCENAFPNESIDTNSKKVKIFFMKFPFECYK